MRGTNKEAFGRQVVAATPVVVMANQHSFKMFCCFCSKKRSYIFVFETKFWIKTKRFLSVLEKFGPKAFVLVRFQICFGTTKSFVLSLENPGAICNVLVSFWCHFLIIQKFCFDSWAAWSKQKPSELVKKIWK